MTSPLGASVASALVADDSLGGGVAGGAETPEIKQPSSLV